MSFIEALMTTSLIQYAMIAALFSSIASGIIGSYVVVKRIVFISGSIAHSILGGMGLCLWLQRTQGITWLTPYYGALVAGIFSALAIGWIQIHYKQREDAVIAALWSTGMALGVIFIAMTPGSNVELTDFLVGNILWVSRSDLWMLFVLDVIVVAVVFLFYEKFLIICFDEDQASLQRVPVQGLYLLLLSLIAISVVLLIQIVGIILVITMLTLPATIANLFTRKLSVMMLLAVIIGMVFSVGGMALSYHWDWPPGATIALIAGLCYILTLLVR